MAKVIGALGFSDPLPDIRFKYHANDTSPCSVDGLRSPSVDVMNITQRDAPGQSPTRGPSTHPPPSTSKASPSCATRAHAAQNLRDQDEVRRAAHLNVWRVLTPPPQDVPVGCL
ncbi:hypothetical protein DHEL01_v209487 [Diaporthe helianthi]|uniref:Uncharacterized protein n=1 Tax=Diaporthe helianthi TaxID=158607 RepID=A0A2P5HPD8_DIAHE|nr:hypothetical protein DHEL01_v209487 [Diaporthe helianthi]